MGIDLAAPDHTTLTRRGQQLEVKLRRARTGRPINLIVDSSGLSIVGEGEWAAAKHGGKGKRGGKKLHLGVDQSSVIVAQALTDAPTMDVAIVPGLLADVDDGLSGFIADTADNTRSVYDAAVVRGATVTILPTKSAATGRWPRCSVRDRVIARVQEVGQRRWQKEAGYHQQARVENTFFGYKSSFGDRLRGRRPEAQQVEALLACNALNRMTELGRPASYATGS